MAEPNGNNAGHSGGALNGQGVGVAIIAIFVGVAVAVIYFASHGALFAQSAAPKSGNTGPQQDITNPAIETSTATVISRDVYDKEPNNGTANPSQQPQEKNTSAMSDAQRELLAIKNFPWSSVSGKYVNDSQQLFDNLQPPTEQKRSSQIPEPLVLSDRILVDATDKDRSSATTSTFQNITSREVPMIESNESSQVQQNNTGNETVVGNSTNSSTSNSTQDSSTDTAGNATGIRVEVSLG